ncbi:three-helix bundle dimerization domain-containing protein [Kitasatospora camelliae]|uniref:Uncharacterized protein n=1 Tax=Kitasatospora camelliae TaxID=3156397 RepID=A0AAU8K6I6_9ACTN
MEPAAPPEATVDQGSPADKEQAAMRTAGERLHRRFDDAVGAGEVDRVLDEAFHRFDGSRIRAFIPILAERIATDILRTTPARELADNPTAGLADQV